MNAYMLFVRLLLLAATWKLGLNLSGMENCDSRMCLDEIQRASFSVLKIKWKPISVFPDKALNKNQR